MKCKKDALVSIVIAMGIRIPEKLFLNYINFSEADSGGI